MSIPDIVSAIGTPLSGMYVDRYGHRTLLMILSSFFILISLSLMLLTDLTPMFGMTLLGFAYSIFASALWPCVPFLVGRHQLATAYGLLSVALNLTLFSTPLIVVIDFYFIHKIGKFKRNIS
jgi:MFS family permease